MAERMCWRRIAIAALEIGMWIVLILLIPNLFELGQRLAALASSTL